MTSPVRVEREASTSDSAASLASDTDSVRCGGDEFVVILPGTGWQGALTFADRLRRRIDEYTFGPTGSPTTVTVSVAVALAHGSDPTSTEMLLQEADAALYRAKPQTATGCSLD